MQLTLHVYIGQIFVNIDIIEHLKIKNAGNFTFTIKQLSNKLKIYEHMQLPLQLYIPVGQIFVNIYIIKHCNVLKI